MNGYEARCRPGGRAGEWRRSRAGVGREPVGGWEGSSRASSRVRVRLHTEVV